MLESFFSRNSDDLLICCFCIQQDLTGVLWFVGANVLVLGSALYFDHLISSTSAELGKLQDHMYILKSV